MDPQARADVIATLTPLVEMIFENSMHKRDLGIADAIETCRRRLDLSEGSPMVPIQGELIYQAISSSPYSHIEDNQAVSSFFMFWKG